MTAPAPKSSRDHAIEATIRRVEVAIADWHRGAATRNQVAERIKEAVGELPEPEPPRTVAGFVSHAWEAWAGRDMLRRIRGHG